MIFTRPFLLLLAILCAAAPDQVPFMADESVLAVPELGKLEYNLKHYRAYTKKIEKKTHQLNKLGKKLLMSFTQITRICVKGSSYDR